MESKKSVSCQDLQQFRRAYESSTLSRVASRAVSKNKIDEVCYDVDHAKRMNHKFSVDIPTMSATNQKSSGRCWIFASLNVLREKLGRDLKLENFEFSQSYISFYDHLEKANTFLENILSTADAPLDDRYVSKLLSAPLGDGGWWEYFVGLCNKYGLVPMDAMPETAQSTSTHTMNMLLNMQLRKDAVILRRELEAGKEPEALRGMKTEMLSAVYNVLAICLGNPPETFDFEYVDKDKVYHADRGLTPRAFYDKYVGRNLNDIVSLITAPIPEVPFYRTCYTQGEESIYGSYQSKRLNLPMEDFKAAVIRQLQDGDLVWFVCDCDYYGCRDEGIWDTGLYDYETLFGLDLQMDKSDLLRYRQCTLNHAMVLTGVNLVDGKPDKWKVQNSWGTEKANRGYFIMSDEWFDRYVFTASIDRKYLTAEQNSLFDQEPIVLPPWNVLG